jgi:hypothetical protein
LLARRKVAPTTSAAPAAAASNEGDEAGVGAGVGSKRKFEDVTVEAAAVSGVAAAGDEGDAVAPAAKQARSE